VSISLKAEHLRHYKDFALLLFKYGRRDFLDHLADNEFQVRVDAIDETRLMEGMQKVANRIALGLVLAALIVGAALLMDVQTSFQIFGYPGLAILLFLAAAAGGLALAVVILANDIRAKRKAKT
jgi:ubiquinone biosynthesis protein